MYNINDTIMYGTQGVCEIVDIETKAIGGEKHKYYVLKPVYEGNSTIFVPADNEKLVSKIRHVLSVDEIKRVISLIPEDEAKWIDNESLRKAEFQRIISEGDRLELIKLIKGIYTHKNELAERGKRLHLTDEKFFKDAEKLLFNEFALVLNIKPEQVIPFIFKQVEIENKIN